MHAVVEPAFLTIFQAIPDGALIVDQDGVIRAMNNQAELLSGYAKEELVGQPVEVLVPIRLRDSHQADRAVYAANPHPRLMGSGRQLVARRAEGTEVPVEISLSPMIGDLVLVLVKDLTERREAQAAQEALIATVSHELKGPVAVIQGWSNRLRRQVSDASETAEGLEVIENQARRIARLGETLTDLAALSEGCLSIETQPVSLLGLIRETANEFQWLCEEVSAVRLDLPERLPPLEGDPDRLAEVLYNLLSNARKYGSVEHPILLRARASASSVSVSVENHGQGIPPEELEVIFKPFKRGAFAHETTGSGLGLAICKGIVEAHGGEIWAESAGHDTGAKFTFRLPLPTSPFAHPSSTPTSSSSRELQ